MLSYDVGVLARLAFFDPHRILSRLLLLLLAGLVSSTFNVVCYVGMYVGCRYALV